MSLQVMPTVLIVDDEPNVRTSFARLLQGHGLDVATAPSGEDAIEQITATPPDLVVMDVQLPGMDGLSTMRAMRELQPRVPVIIMTGRGSTEVAIEATKFGACEYMLKPFEPEAMLAVIDAALESSRVMNRSVELDPGAPEAGADALIGQHPTMQEIYKRIGRVAATDAAVLIRGETGTGKELVARAIYQHGLRANQPLLVVNCTAIPETLLESELFGYERGAFTGASQRRIGKFEQAHGGTLFMDEIGDMPVSTQAKILRVLQDGTFQRLGGNTTLNVDVRLLTATNRNLEQGMADHTFREDLYHRLGVVTIDLPALRQRRQDIPRLTEYFISRFADRLGMQRPPLAPEAQELLEQHGWPGNVRELEHCVHRLLIFTQGRAISAADVQRALTSHGDAAVPLAVDADPLAGIVQQFLAGYDGQSAHSDLIDQVDRLLVMEALRLTGGNQSHACRLLGLSRPTLLARIRRFGIQL